MVALEVALDLLGSVDDPVTVGEFGGEDDFISVLAAFEPFADPFLALPSLRGAVSLSQMI